MKFQWRLSLLTPKVDVGQKAMVNRVNPQGAPIELSVCQDRPSYNYIKIMMFKSKPKFDDFDYKQSRFFQDPAKEISEDYFMC